MSGLSPTRRNGCPLLPRIRAGGAVSLATFGLVLQLTSAAAARDNGRGVKPETGRLDLGTKLLNPQGKPTRRNCTSGLCEVVGGTKAGENLFHRFRDFWLDGDIKGVTIQSDDAKNVILGVTGRQGSFINREVKLLGGANSFFLLSPGGITVGSGGSFVNKFGNIQSLTLSTATGLRLDNHNVFDVYGTTLKPNNKESLEEFRLAFEADPILGREGLLTQAPIEKGGKPEPRGPQAVESGTSSGFTPAVNGDIILQSAGLAIDRSLLLDAQQGTILLQGSNSILFGGASSSGLLAGREVNNRGSLVIEGGPLSFEGGGVDTGVYSIGDAASLNFASGQRLLATGSDVRGGGQMTVSGGVVDVQDLFTIASTGQVSVTRSGKLYLNIGAHDKESNRSPGDVTFSNAFLLDGSNPDDPAVLGGLSNVTMQGGFAWRGNSRVETGGGWSVGGNNDFAATLTTKAGTTIEGIGVKTVSRNIVNDGTISFGSGASLVFESPADSFINQIGGTIDISAGASGDGSVISGPGGFSLQNFGTISKSSPTPQSLSFLSPSPFVNRGTLSVQAGSLLLDFVEIQQTGAIHLAPPGNSSALILGVTPFQNDGLIAGNGRIAWVGEGGTSGNTLINRGVIRPGGSIGSLVIEGNFRQEASESNPNPSLEFEVAGGSQGEYDTLVIQGSVELNAGFLRVNLINDYQPQSGDEFSLISGSPFTIAPGFEEFFPSNVSFERVLVDQTETISYVVRTSNPVAPRPPAVSPPPGQDPRPSSTPASQRRVEAPEERLFLIPPLIDQNIFLTALGQGEDESDLLESSGLEEDLDVSFQVSGEGNGIGEVGATRTLSSQEARRTFLAKEAMAQRYTASRLGLATAGAIPVPSPEALQRHLQEVAAWVRSGDAAPGIDLR